MGSSTPPCFLWPFLRERPQPPNGSVFGACPSCKRSSWIIAKSLGFFLPKETGVPKRSSEIRMVKRNQCRVSTASRKFTRLYLLEKKTQPFSNPSDEIIDESPLYIIGSRSRSCWRETQHTHGAGGPKNVDLQDDSKPPSNSNGICWFNPSLSKI